MIFSLVIATGLQPYQNVHSIIFNDIMYKNNNLPGSGPAMTDAKKLLKTQRNQLSIFMQAN